jgi:single-strand selective monofunctional uracil DNA glycosylase
MRRLRDATRRLSRAIGGLSFGEPVAYVYNPLDYARAAHEAYLERWARPGVHAVLLGMNPGPFGMAQTGVPFGDVAMVRDFLGIQAAVQRPAREHPKRPVLGFDCPRSEVSGTRLWGWARTHFETPERFFERFFVFNYCPLAFMADTGRNITPDRLPAAERLPLFEACDTALRAVVKHLEPRWVIGVGAFATARAREALDSAVRVGTILHPSPASPRANRGWAEEVERELRALGALG